jgi:hypothetical protein
MANDNNTSNEAWWAVQGYRIADAAMGGQELTSLFIQARERRELEYRNIELETRFASVVRQLADAYINARDTRSFVQQLISLRRQQLGPTLDPDARKRLFDAGYSGSGDV